MIHKLYLQVKCYFGSQDVTSRPGQVAHAFQDHATPSDTVSSVTHDNTTRIDENNMHLVDIGSRTVIMPAVTTYDVKVRDVKFMVDNHTITTFEPERLLVLIRTHNFDRRFAFRLSIQHREVFEKLLCISSEYRHFNAECLEFDNLVQACALVAQEQPRRPELFISSKLEDYIKADHKPMRSGKLSDNPFVKHYRRLLSIASSVKKVAELRPFVDAVPTVHVTVLATFVSGLHVGFLQREVDSSPTFATALQRLSKLGADQRLTPALEKLQLIAFDDDVVEPTGTCFENIKVKHLPSVFKHLAQYKVTGDTYVADVKCVSRKLLHEMVERDLCNLGHDVYYYPLYCPMHCLYPDGTTADYSYDFDCGYSRQLSTNQCLCGELWSVTTATFHEQYVPHKREKEAVAVKIEDSEFVDNSKISRRIDYRRKKRCESQHSPTNLLRTRLHDKYVGGRRRKFYPTADDVATMDVDEIAGIIEEVVLKTWHATQTKHWSSFVIGLYDIVKKAAPDYAIHKHLKQHVEFFGKEFSDLKQSSWDEILIKTTNGLHNWEVFCRTETAKFLTTIIGYVTIAIFHPEATFKLGTKELKLLTKRFKSYDFDVTNVVTSSWNLIQDALNVVNTYSQTGDMAQALIRESEYVKLINDIATLQGKHDAFCSGNLLATVGMTDDEYVTFLKGVIDRIGTVRLTVPTPLKARLDTELKTVTQMTHKAVMALGASNTRYKPYAYFLMGLSQIGKTVFNRRLLSYLLAVLEVPHTQEFIYSIKEGKKYWDGYKNFMTGATFDDIANVITLEPELAKLLLYIINNEPYNLEGADLSLKGVLYCLLKVLGCTGNVPSMNLESQINEVTAIHNRFSAQILVELKPEYGTLAGERSKLDISKMSDQQREELFPDIYQFTVYKVEIESTENDLKLDFDKSTKLYTADKWRRVVATMDGVKMEKVDIDTFLRYMARDVLSHHAKQEALLQQVKKLDDELVCKQCHMPLDKCACNVVCWCDAPRLGGVISPACRCHVVLHEAFEKFVPTTDTKIANGPPHLRTVENVVMAERGQIIDATVVEELYPRSTHIFGGHEFTEDEFFEQLQEFLLRRRAAHRKDKALHRGYFAVPNARQLIYRTADEFSNNLFRYVSDRLSSSTKKLTDIGISMEEESNRFLIALCERYYIKFSDYIDGFKSIWPLLFIDPDTPNYDSIVYNSNWGQRWVKRLSVASYALSTLTSALVWWVVPQCWFTMLMSPFLGYYIASRSRKRVYRTLGWYIRSGNAELHYTWWKKANEICFTAWNSVELSTTELMGELARTIRGTITKRKDIIGVAAIHGPKLTNKFIVGSACASLFRRIRTFQRTMNVMPTAGYHLTLEECIEHNQDRPELLIKYQNSLDDVPVGAPPEDQIQLNQLIKLLCSQTYSMCINGQRNFTAVAVRTNILCFPCHAFVDGLEVAMVRRANPTGTKTNACVRIRLKKDSIVSSNGDTIYYNCTSVGTVKDITRYYRRPGEPIRTSLVAVTRSANGMTDVHGGKFVTKLVNTTNNGEYEGRTVRFDGFEYESDFGVIGTSGSFVISDCFPVRIMGMHVGLGTNHVATWLNSEPSAKEFFSMRPSAPVLPNSGNFRKFRYDEHVLVYGVSEKSIIYRMEPGNFAYYGSTPQLATFNKLDGVVQTPISKQVREEFGAKEYGCPKLRGPNGDDNALKWLNDVNKRTKPSGEVPQSLLDWAFNDYVNGIAAPTEEEKRCFAPLSRHEILNGRDGVLELGPMNFNGSVSPLPGTLRSYCDIVQDGPREYKRLKDNVFWDEVDINRSYYLRDERAYSMFTAFPKIEPTPVAKDKVRCIVNPEIANKLEARRVILPIIAFLERRRYESECAVGINPYGVQWDELKRHFTRSRRCFAMDYSGYDLSMSAQMSIASYAVVVHFARQLGYCEDDVKIIVGLGTDASYPVIVVASEILMFYGSFPSGCIETSGRNSIANSLLLRVAYVKAYLLAQESWFNILTRDPLPPPFRLYVFLIIYGDDNAGDVSYKCYWFNMATVQYALSLYGFKITDANKSARVPKFIHFSQVDFLKRGFKHNERLGMFVGILTEDSILKRLCAICKPSGKHGETVTSITTANIGSALEEWALYGRKIYDNRRTRLLKILEVNYPYVPPCATRSYDQCMLAIERRAHTRHFA